MRTKEDARALIDAVKKVPLGFYPTPFHKLERMSELTGVNLWVKREDFSGVSLFGGNKVRKLEFLLAGRGPERVRHRFYLWRDRIQSRDADRDCR